MAALQANRPLSGSFAEVCYSISNVAFTELPAVRLSRQLRLG